MGESGDYGSLELLSAIGFNGNVNGGLVIHPDREHMIYPLGCNIVIRNLNTGKQELLSGHKNNVSCLTISKSGKYIASGQVTHMGFKADIIVWDYENQKLLYRLTLHKVKVQALSFSCNELYLVSLGGEDDGSVVVWNLQTAQSICGSPSAVPSAGLTFTVKFANNSDNVFVTAGDGTLRVWELDLANRKIRPTECNLGQLKRIVKCIEVDPADDFFYCGTTSGDILKINMNTRLLANYGPAKGKFSRGITDLKLLKTGDMLVGSGAGSVAMIKGGNGKYATGKQEKVPGDVSSISLRGEGHQFFVGTNKGEVLRFNLIEFNSEKVITAPYQPVLDVAFPSATAQLFATCSGNDIRVWHTSTSRELLRIVVPNMTCNAVLFTEDGQSIVSGWNDGKIRAFLPESGKLLYIINNAHNAGVTAIAASSDCTRIVSGGGEGQVRVWDLSYQPLTQSLAAAMKEHKSKVTCIKITSDNRECVTASADGTCIIWDLVRFARNQMVLCNTLFQCVCYHPDGTQIVTAGTDRKVAYWEVFDGSQIRELEGSKSGSINGVDLSASGKCMVSGGDDRLIKVWDYNNGTVTHVGVGHSGNILRCKLSPGLQNVVSVSQDGAVLIWKFPSEISDDA